jgi:WD40 repeat protein
MLPASQAKADDRQEALPEFAIARLGTLQWRWDFRLGSSFTTLAFSPDGKLLAAGVDAGLVVWDSDNGKPVPWFTPKSSLQAAAFTKDGKTLVSFGSAPGMGKPLDPRRTTRLLQRWEVGTGKLVMEKVIQGNRFGRESPTFAAHGRLLVQCVNDAINFWDTATGEKVAQVSERRDTMPIAVSRDGKALAVVRWTKPPAESETRLYDLPTGKVRWVLSRPNETQSLPVFNADGTRLATMGLSSMRIWDTATGKVIHEISNLRGRAKFSPDGKQVACIADRTIRLYALPSCKEIGRFQQHSGLTHAVEFSPDGKRLVVARDQTLTVWDMAAGKQLNAFAGHEGPISALAFSPDGKRLATGSDDDGLACIWDLVTREIAHRLPGHYGAVASVAWTDDGKMLATGDGAPNYQTGGGETHIRLWNMPDATLMRRFPAHLNGVISLDFSPDAKTLVSGGHDARVRLWDVGTGKRLAQAIGADGTHKAQFAPDSKTLLVGSQENLSLWRSDLKEKLHDLIAVDQVREQVHAARFLGKGTKACAVTASSGADGRLSWQSWDLASAKSCPPTGRIDNRHYTEKVAISPDGRTLAVSSLAEEVELWDTDTSTQFARLPADARYGVTLAFSADSKTLATGCRNTTILLWDVVKARAAAKLAAPGE